MTKKFLAALFVLGLLTSSATALTITSNLTPDNHMSDTGDPIVYLNQGEGFSYTFTAQNAVGEVNWRLVVVDSNGTNAFTDLDGNVIGGSKCYPFIQHRNNSYRNRHTFITHIFHRPDSY